MSFHSSDTFFEVLSICCLPQFFTGLQRLLLPLCFSSHLGPLLLHKKEDRILGARAVQLKGIKGWRKKKTEGRSIFSAWVNLQHNLESPDQLHSFVTLIIGQIKCFLDLCFSSLVNLSSKEPCESQLIFLKFYYLHLVHIHVHLPLYRYVLWWWVQVFCKWRFPDMSVSFW